MEILKKHSISILAILSIIVLALPLCTITEEVSIIGYDGGSSTQTVNGFAALKESFLGIVLIIGPLLLIVMNYIKQLEKYKGILAVIIPIICIISMIIVFIQVKGTMMSASGGGDVFEMDVSASMGIGGILAFLSYIATAVAGAVTYHNFTLDKAGFEKLKSESMGLMHTAQEKVAEVAQNIPAKNSEQTVNSNVQKADETSSVKPIIKKTNLNRTEEILALIEKLSKMKESGILTEEEFEGKKRELLTEI